MALVPLKVLAALALVEVLLPLVLLEMLAATELLKVLTASLVLGCLEEAGDPNHMCTLGLCSIFTVSVAFSRRHTTVA